MKFDKRIVEDINSKLYVPDLLSTERGDKLPEHDHNVSCIYHSDKNPSMRVYHEQGRHAFCFSCGKTVTPYSIIKTLFGFSFTEVVEYLQQNYGYEIPQGFSEDTSDIKSNEHVAQRIKILRKFNSPKLLNLISKSLYLDSKSGKSTQLDKLYDKVISLKESSVI